MSFIIIYNALQLNRPQGPYRPMSPGERVVAVIVTIVVVAGLAVSGVFLWKSYKAYTIQVAAFHQEWDAGRGHPAANKITTGKTVVVAAHPGSINEIWSTCTYKTCYREDFPHYPVVVPIGTLRQRNGCYVIESAVKVDSLMVSTTRPGVYSVELRADGKSANICSTAQRSDKDQLVVWSDSPDAVR